MTARSAEAENEYMETMESTLNLLEPYELLGSGPLMDLLDALLLGEASCRLVESVEYDGLAYLAEVVRPESHKVARNVRLIIRWAGNFYSFGGSERGVAERLWGKVKETDIKTKEASH